MRDRKCNLSFFLLFFLLLQTCFSFTNNKSAITFVFNPGRFGDRLLTYINAKWVSYKYDIPLYYPKFKYSDQLTLSKEERRYNKKMKRKFKKTVSLKRTRKRFIQRGEEVNLKIQRDAGYLYVSNYYFRPKIDWKDKGFVAEIKKMLSPINPTKQVCVPKDRISVAVHVRKGGGFDGPLLSEANQKVLVTKENIGMLKKKYMDVKHPIKFPPDKYYISEIKRLYEMFNKNPLHVHVFTDDKNPKRIVEKYKNELGKENITFSWRKEGNRHDKNVIADFYSMTYYDCLIRPDSNMSLCAEKIGDFFIAIFPGKFYWDKDHIVDDVKIKVNVDNFKKISKFTTPVFMLNGVIAEYL